MVKYIPLDRISIIKGAHKCIDYRDDDGLATKRRKTSSMSWRDVYRLLKSLSKSEKYKFRQLDHEVLVYDIHNRLAIELKPKGTFNALRTEVVVFSGTWW